MNSLRMSVRRQTEGHASPAHPYMSPAERFPGFPVLWGLGSPARLMSEEEEEELEEGEEEEKLVEVVEDKLEARRR